MTATSPVRIRADLVAAAATAAGRFHRSTKAQIEYWIALGRRVDGVVDPEKLLDVASGTANLRVEPSERVTVEPDSLLDRLEQGRTSGSIARSVAAQHPVRYRASANNPGLLERVDDVTGTVTIGVFRDGAFAPVDTSTLTPGGSVPGASRGAAEDAEASCAEAEN